MANSDSQGNRKIATSGIAESNLTTARNLQQQQLAALNLVPGEKIQQNGKYVYLTAPKTLERLFGLPLSAPGGDPFKRRVSSGWGDARVIKSADGSVTKTLQHKGLDFPAPVGSPVFACYSGFVTFTGAQTTTGAKKIFLPKVDNQDDRVSPPKELLGGGNILDKNGTRVLNIDETGFGGLIVNITHDDIFQGYMTQYMHLSEIAIEPGKYVTEGQLIGYVGITGIGSGPHLHWQVQYNGVLVKPEGLVPSTSFIANTTGYSSSALEYYKEYTPKGQAAVVDSVTQSNKNADRSINMANQTRSELIERGAKQLSHVANYFIGQANLVYQAVGAFLEGATEIEGPMVFDFDTGLWSDGEPV